MILTLIVTWFFQARRHAQQERDRFFSLTRDMLCVATFDGYFKRVNPAWEKALGFTQEEMMGKPFLDFIHPDDREDDRGNCKPVQRKGSCLIREPVSLQGRLVSVAPVERAAAGGGESYLRLSAGHDRSQADGGNGDPAIK